MMEIIFFALALWICVFSGVALAFNKTIKGKIAGAVFLAVGIYLFFLSGKLYEKDFLFAYFSSGVDKSKIPANEIYNANAKIRITFKKGTLEKVVLIPQTTASEK